MFLIVGSFSQCDSHLGLCLHGGQFLVHLIDAAADQRLLLFDPPLPQFRSEFGISYFGQDLPGIDVLSRAEVKGLDETVMGRSDGFLRGKANDGRRSGATRLWQECQSRGDTRQ